ncbi:MAG: G8 domain-containing protein, partial [Planctomycetota bacterium]
MSLEAQVMATRSGDWSDAQTWGGDLPAEGEMVMIPMGRRVALDTHTPSLNGVRVMGQLVFEDEQDVSLTTRWLAVMGNNSKLQVGTEDRPFEHRATITFTGTDETQNVMGEEPFASGTKFLMVMNGAELDLHGVAAEKVSWTQLNGSVARSDTQITLLTETGWEPGDQIVIAPSAFDPYEAEKVTVTAVDGPRVTFTPALSHGHYGQLQTIAGRTVDQRAEVGLLTRNIKLQGAADSLESKFGGHGMVMPGAFARVSGVEFYRMGQAGHEARYPFHWHLVDRHQRNGIGGAGQYVRDSSIHDSFQRAVVVHGTNDVLVQDNVAYNVFNHTFVPAEDGDERNNHFIGNLSVLTISPDREDFAFKRKNFGKSSQSEHRSANFWSRSKSHVHTMIGNHAAGNDGGIGFFIDGRFRSHGIKKADRAAQGVGVFRDNVAHSVTSIMRNVTTYGPLTDGHGFMFALEAGDGDHMFVEGLLAYKNVISGGWIEPKSVTVRDSIFADNSAGLSLFRSKLEDSLIVGQTENRLGGMIPFDGVPRRRDGSRRLSRGHLVAIGGGIQVAFQGGPKHPVVEDVTFVDVTPAAITVRSNSFSEPLPVFSGIKLVNTPAIQRFQLDENQFLIDADGSLSGIAPGRFSYNRLDSTSVLFGNSGLHFTPDRNPVAGGGTPTPRPPDADDDSGGQAGADTGGGDSGSAGGADSDGETDTNNPDAPGNAPNVLTFTGKDAQVLPHEDYMLSANGSVRFTFNAQDVTRRSQGLFSKDAKNYATGGHLTVALERDTIVARLQSTDESFVLKHAGIEQGKDH